MPKQKAIFLDRDGVINDAIVIAGKPYPPATMAAVKLADDVLPALRNLKDSGYLLIGATNQPDVARGKTARSTVEAINAYLLERLPLKTILVCYHDDADQCACRKPEAGLLLQAAREYDIDLASSYMIGDRWKDIEAGRRAGCKTIWIDRHYQESGPKTPPDYIACTLGEAEQWIIATQTQSLGEQDEIRF